MNSQRCFICGEHNPHVIEQHHVVPRRFGGTDNRRNLVTLCSNCHSAVEKIYDDEFFHIIGGTSVEEQQQEIRNEVIANIASSDRITQHDIAEALNLTPAHISRIVTEHEAHSNERAAQGEDVAEQVVLHAADFDDAQQVGDDNTDRYGEESSTSADAATEIANDILENKELSEFVGDNYGQKYIDKDLIALEYGIGHNTTKQVKKILKQEVDMDVL